MKLTANEVKLLTALSKRHKRRKWDGWFSFLATVALIVATYGYGMFPSLIEWPFLGIAAGGAATYLMHVYLAVRPEDKLIELLQRYVNRDPEAVAQLFRAVETAAVVD